jgi:hypothetical protein
MAYITPRFSIKGGIENARSYTQVLLATLCNTNMICKRRGVTRKVLESESVQ